jgi:hypothetical protein
MPNSPRLGYSELVEGQDAPETTVNLINRYLEQMATRAIVKDKDIDDPPGSPADGDAYIVATASPTGAWTGWGNRIAFYAAGWYSITPIEGSRAYVQDENLEYEFNGSAWAAAGGGGTTFASASEVRTGTEAAKALSPDNVFDASATVALTPGTNVSVDMSSGFNFTLAMGGNYTLDSPTNEKVGQSGFIQITQDGTGSRTLAYGPEWKFAGGTDPVLSTAASAVDVLFYQVLSTGNIYANLVKAIA